MDWDRIENIISLAKSDDYKVCVWGGGYVGTNYGYELLKELGINIDFYCDNNDELIGKEIKDGIPCVNKEQITNQVICFVMVSRHLVNDITVQLTEMGVTNIINYLDLCEYQSKNFFEFQKRNQIAIYTCVVGEYDEVEEPEMIENNCDYYIISDKAPKKNTIYNYINIDKLGKSDLDDTRKNRYCKINAHKVFPQYRYSIYIDGNIVLKKGIMQYIQKLPKTRIIALARASHTSIYAEALRCMMHGRDDKQKFLDQTEKYWLEGMPEDFGLVAPTIMVREHNNPICVKLMEEWWKEVAKYSKRDMISLPYVLWKNGYTINDIETLSDIPDVLDGDEWTFKRDHKKSRIK